MKILFIYPDVITPMINFCPAVQMLSPVLKKAGHEVALLHINNDYGVKYDKDAVIDFVKKQKADLLAVTSTSFNYKYANEIANWLKEKFPEILRILGGSHSTVQPEDFKDSNFDAFCVGEGEEPLLDFVDALENKKDWLGIPNLLTKSKQGVVRNNPVRGFLKNLDALPYQDFDIVDTWKILKLRGGWISLSFSRGCPFECNFCINHIYKHREIGPKNTMAEYLRRRSVKNTVEEMESLANKFKGQIKVFNFDDDLLPMDKKWMTEFAESYAEKILKPFGIKYAINCRASFLDDNLARLFAASGCLEVRIGFETGNEKLREEILKKPVSNADLIKAFAACDKYGVHTNAFSMMGIPGETKESVQDTVDMIFRLKTYLIRMTFLYPYAHTKIYDFCIENKLFKNYAVHEDSFTESPLKFERLDNAEIFCCRFLFPWYVNVKWFGSEPEGKMYKEAIANFEKRKFSELKESILEIVEKDKELSGKCKRPHYCYFQGNMYYFQLNGKYDAKGNTLVFCQ